MLPSIPRAPIGVFVGQGAGMDPKKVNDSSILGYGKNFLWFSLQYLQKIKFWASVTFWGCDKKVNDIAGAYSMCQKVFLVMQLLC